MRNGIGVPAAAERGEQRDLRGGGIGAGLDQSVLRAEQRGLLLRQGGEIGQPGAILAARQDRGVARGVELAKDMNVPVLALSQLSRAVEQREDKRPMLSDLRESGSIEQDADMVWFVFREDYYMMQREPKRPMEGDDGKVFEDHAKWATEVERVYGLAELIVAKQRHGATGKVVMKFDPTITRFTDFAGY